MDAQTLEALKGRFRFGDWAGRNRLPENLLVRGYFLPASKVLADWTLHRSSRLVLAGSGVGVHTMWKKGDQLLRFDFRECPSRSTAHEQLPEVLGDFQAPAIERQVDTEEIGDVAFAMDSSRCVVFSRANVLFLLACASAAPVNTQELASAIDDELVTKPAEDPRVRPVQVRAAWAGPAGERALRGDRSAEAFAADPSGPDAVTLLRAGVPEPLDVSVDGGDGDQVRVFAPSGELSVEAGTVLYQPSKKGDATISVYVIEKDGRTGVRQCRTRAT